MKSIKNFFFREIKSHGKIVPKDTPNTRRPYEHQREAMQALDKMDTSDSFSTMVVIPTGGGKTYVASNWLLKNAVDEGKKVLWTAHTHMLLDQAAESFIKNSYVEIVPHKSSFSYRIISGARRHDSADSIDPSDNILIVGKDSIIRNLSNLETWLDGEEEIYFVIDEAHHSTAKTYRRLIECVKAHVPNVKLIGLTATPFRTATKESGLLSKIYTDGIVDGEVVHGESGIAYQISLKELIMRRILARPHFDCYDTEQEFGTELGADALESIENLDTLPNDITAQMVASTARNKLIVDTYCKNKDKYGQTIVFAVNIVHAIQLSALFRKAGIRADYVVSNATDSPDEDEAGYYENEDKIEAYQNGELQVLVNVNILTEGVDLPQTKTVFLTRPTVSRILMTQMVGRALRGVEAGGTDECYVVSFIDDWNERISWVNPASLFVDENEFDDDAKKKQAERIVRMISASKIEEFASILSEAINTDRLEALPFTQRIPLGMYAFTCLGEDGTDCSYQVMAYDGTLEAYCDMMEHLPALFESFNATDEFLSDELLSEMEEECRKNFFSVDMLPPYDERDIIKILKFYAQYETAPKFYTFDQIDKEKLDVTKIAGHIYKERMDSIKKAEYINYLWETSDYNLLRLFFGRKANLFKQIDIELMKLTSPGIYEDEVKSENCKLIDISSHRRGKVSPAKEKEICDELLEWLDDPADSHSEEKPLRMPFRVTDKASLDKEIKRVIKELEAILRRDDKSA